MHSSANPQKNIPLYNIRKDEGQSQTPEKQSNNQNIAQLNKTWSGSESQDRYIHYLRDQNSWLKNQLSWKESELNADTNHKSLYPPQFNFSFAQVQYSRLLGEFRAVKEELDNLKKDAEEKVNKNNKEMEKLQKRNEELEAENQSLKDELEKGKQEAKDRNSKSDELSKLNEKANAEKKELQDEIKKLKLQLEEAQKIKTRAAPILPKKAAREEKRDEPAASVKSSKKDNVRHKSVERSPKVTKDKEVIAHKRRRNKSESNDKRKSQKDRNEKSEKDTKNEKEQKEERRSRRHKSERNNDDGEICENNQNEKDETKTATKERDIDVSHDKSNKKESTENDKNKDYYSKKRSSSPSREKDKLNAREIKLLKSALKAQTEGNKDLEQQLKTQEDTIKDLKMELMLAQLQKDELKSNNEKLKTRNETSQNEVDHVLKLFNNQTLESKQLSTEVAKLRDDLETKEQLISRLKSNIVNARKLERKINKLENDNESLNSKNRLLEYENTSLKDMLTNKDYPIQQQQQLYQAQQQQYQQQQLALQQKKAQQLKKRSTKNDEDSDDSFLRKNEENVKELTQRIESLYDKFSKDSQLKSKQIDELGKKVISLKESQNELAKNIGSKSNS